MTGETGFQSLRSLYEGMGYRRFQMSRFEEYGLYVANKDFLLSDQVITFTDASGKLMALKPDVTLSIIKNVTDVPGQVQKLYYSENVYRPSGATHAFKEILQSGLECVGDLTAYDVAEVVYLAVKSLESLADTFVLDISHMGIIAEVLKNSGLSQEGQKQALTFLHQKNSHEMQTLCQGEGVCGEGLLALTRFSGDWKELENLVSEEKLLELRSVLQVLEKLGAGDRVQVDFSCANDLLYYSGLVFKGYLPGIPERVLSGGQYDKLLIKMGKSSRAIGFAIYMDLLSQEAPEQPLTYRIDPTGADPAQVIAAAQRLGKTGRVLVSREETLESRFTVTFENGEEVLHG